jgi:hypothetical protein
MGSPLPRLAHAPDDFGVPALIEGTSTGSMTLFLRFIVVGLASFEETETGSEVALV